MNESKIEQQQISRLEESAKASAHLFRGIPEGIINTRAENESEEYVANLGIEDEEERENVKNQFKEVFIQELIHSLS